MKLPSVPRVEIKLRSVKHPVALHKHLGIEPGQLIPKSMLKDAASKSPNPKIRQLAAHALKMVGGL